MGYFFIKKGDIPLAVLYIVELKYDELQANWETEANLKTP